MDTHPSGSGREEMHRIITCSGTAVKAVGGQMKFAGVEPNGLLLNMIRWQTIYRGLR